jgi:hypothetical protein
MKRPNGPVQGHVHNNNIETFVMIPISTHQPRNTSRGRSAEKGGNARKLKGNLRKAQQMILPDNMRSRDQ